MKSRSYGPSFVRCVCVWGGGWGSGGLNLRGKMHALMGFGRSGAKKKRRHGSNLEN